MVVVPSPSWPTWFAPQHLTPPVPVSAHVMVVPAGRRMFLGTRWHEDDIYQFLIRTGWPSLVRGALRDGVALWPAYWPAERLIGHGRQHLQA